MTTLFYKALILQGEIWCWSLLGLKGLIQIARWSVPSCCLSPTNLQKKDLLASAVPKVQKLVAEKQAAAVAAVAVVDGHYFPSEPWCVLEDANICSCLCDTDPKNKACIQNFSSLTCIRKYCEKKRIVRISLQDLMAKKNSMYVTLICLSLSTHSKFNIISHTL